MYSLLFFIFLFSFSIGVYFVVLLPSDLIPRDLVYHCEKSITSVVQGGIDFEFDNAFFFFFKYLS